TYTGTVQDDYSWSIDVAGSDLAAHSQVTAYVSGTDDAGNAFSGPNTTLPYEVDTDVPSTAIWIQTVAGDDVINATEANETITVSGKVNAGWGGQNIEGDAKVGDTVVLQVGDQRYEGKVTADGDDLVWNIDVPGSVLAENSAVSASITLTDEAGNSFTTDAALPYQVDTTAPTITVNDSETVLTTDDTSLRGADETSTTSSLANSFTVNGGNVTGYALGLEQPGSDSGLTVSASGEAIRFYMENGEVVGRVGGEDGAEALRISVNDQGDVTLAQSMAVSHPDTSEDNEAVSLEGAGIRLTVTAGDDAGNSTESSIDPGSHLKILDDGISFNAGQSTYTPTTDAANVPTIQDGDYSFADGDWSYAQSIGFGDFTVEARGLEGNGALVSQS
ncbi:DUF5801 repeats-in-toxin domain-containing protein, partial [Kushneria aurantia]|uniref:DUF5801 repeats-in-toxin domain-containing protein n=1 Tax=Kushneria aurantia TaxID=504092 RepID=UPI00146DED1F